MDSGAQPRRYHQWVFDADLLCGLRDDGKRVRFSRLERALLATLCRRPGRLFSRDELLGAMRAEPEEQNDRNVDFVINRLRKKLGDRARQPDFIATQYGEGYSWVAPLETARPCSLLIVGPVRGLPNDAERSLVLETLEQLRCELAAQRRFGAQVALIADWSSAKADAASCRYSASADFLHDRGGLRLALALHHERDGRLVRVFRCDLGQGLQKPQLQELAEALTAAIWRDLALPAGAATDPAGPPLELRMQEAALTLCQSAGDGWRYVAERLEAERRASPADPELAVMWGCCLYARMLIRLDVDPTPEAYRRIIDEIDALVSPVLPSLRANPLLAVAAARLLFLAGPRRLALVEDVLEEARAQSTVFAAVLPLHGAIHAYRGDLSLAEASYDDALTFAAAGSEFEIYLLVRKSLLALARGDLAAAQALLRRITATKPGALAGLELFYLAPGAPMEAHTQRAFAKLTASEARRLLAYAYFTTAQYFADPRHQRNIMAGAAWRLIERFGASVVADLPAELDLTSSDKRDVIRRLS